MSLVVLMPAHCKVKPRLNFITSPTKVLNQTIRSTKLLWILRIENKVAYRPFLPEGNSQFIYCVIVINEVAETQRVIRVL